MVRKKVHHGCSGFCCFTANQHMGLEVFYCVSLSFCARMHYYQIVSASCP